MKVMAHRGFSSRAPENTLAAFKKAIDFGCRWIELDVQLTADKVPVIFHDQNIGRCTSGEGRLADFTLEELRCFSAGSWFSPEFSAEVIPSLEEVLLLAKSHKISINIELKTYSCDDEVLLCHEVARVIKSVDIDKDQLLFSSFDRSALKSIKHELPDIRRGLLWEKMPYNAFEFLKELDAYSVHCNYRHLNEYQALCIKEKGYQLYCYTPDDPEEVQKHWQWGVDMMITNAPDRYKL